MLSKKILLFIVCSLLSAGLFAQDLTSGLIRKIPERKKSLYFSKGIFHIGNSKTSGLLKGIRHNYSSKEQFERIVLDFDAKAIPQVYGAILNNKNKIHLDLFNTDLGSNMGSFGKSKFIETINFIPISGESLSVEILLNTNIQVDLFSLKNPPRLVLDVKKL